MKKVFVYLGLLLVAVAVVRARFSGGYGKDIRHGPHQGGFNHHSRHAPVGEFDSRHHGFGDARQGPQFKRDAHRSEFRHGQDARDFGQQGRQVKSYHKRNRDDVTKHEKDTNDNFVVENKKQHLESHVKQDKPKQQKHDRRQSHEVPERAKVRDMQSHDEKEQPKQRKPKHDRRQSHDAPWRRHSDDNVAAEARKQRQAHKPEHGRQQLHQGPQQGRAEDNATGAKDHKHQQQHIERHSRPLPPDTHHHRHAAHPQEHRTEH